MLALFFMNLLKHIRIGSLLMSNIVSSETNVLKLSSLDLKIREIASGLKFIGKFGKDFVHGNVYRY